MPRRLLLIEDDPSFLRRLEANLRAAGYDIATAASGEAALDILADSFFDLVVTDIRLPGIGGLELLARIKAGGGDLDPRMPVVVLTSVRDVETAVGAMRQGAADYLTKESEKQEILVRIERVLAQSAILNENRNLRNQLERHGEFGELLGESPPMREIKQEIARLAGQEIPVLITGETGVGKELVARALHHTGATATGPFVEVNCGALPDENLLLSELFGHERGAFTGAAAMRRGQFEMAQGGTLFLDEIGEMPLGAQTKILKTIESLEIVRLGGSKPLRVHCRLLFATNKNLENEVREGRFRQDLLYRVNLLPIAIPPLRERRDDIALLTRAFLARFCEKYNRTPARFDDAAVERMQNYAWPGNVRELRNVVERLVIRLRGETIGEDDLRRCGVADGVPAGRVVSLPEEGAALEEIEREAIVQALDRCEWSQKLAADMLHISVDRMNARVRKFGLTHPSWRVNR